MSLRLALALAATTGLLLSGAGGRQADAQDTRPVFRSSTSVVSVSAVVRDRNGRFVRNLTREDFIIAESGRPKKILDFRAESDGPVRVALLFDVSGSMRVATRAADARQAARHVLSALQTADEAGMFSFDSRLNRVHDFTSDIPALTAALEHVEPPYGQTSLYDAVAATARVVANEGRESQSLVQRRAVVVLTDGIDTKSRLTPGEVTGIASEIDVPVYIVAVMSAVDDPRLDGRLTMRDQETSELHSLAHWTGGDFFITSAPAHASVAARRVIEELRHQYVLAFEASAKAGWHPLEVRARKRDLVVRARAGYKAGGATGP